MRQMTRSIVYPPAVPRLFSSITLLAICLGMSVAAQTRVDLSTQSKGIDFQTQPYTKPLKTGASLPSICTPAELFFLSSAPPGSNIYACTAVNSWSPQAPGALSCPTCTTNSTAATVNAIMLGGGGQVISALGSLGTFGTVLHGNPTGAPTFGAVNLGTDVLGNLGVGNLNGGTGASSATFWRGDGTWATPAGTAAATVTHTGGALTLNQLMLGAGGGDAKVGDLSGDVTTSGGTATTLATVNPGPGACGDSTHVCVVTTNGKGLVMSQTATAIAAGGTGTVTHSGGPLPVNAPVIGNGAGDVAVGTTLGNTTKFVTYAGSVPTANDCAKFDSNGNLTTNGAACGTGGGSGAMTIQSSGTAVGTRSILNIMPGAGISTAISDTGSQINLQQTIDSAVVQTRANEQSGQTLLCSSASASGSTYTCSMSPVLTAYTKGMTVNWQPDLNGVGASTTLNIDTLGAKPVKLSDGITNPGASDIVAGRLYTLWFDGANFRMPAGGVTVSGSGGSPVSVMFWPFGVGLSTSGASEPEAVANRVHYYEVYVPSPGIIVAKFSSFTYPGGDAGAIAWGIYDSTCSLLANGNSSTVTGTATQQVRTWTFSPAASLPGGKYFFAFASDNTATQFYAAGGSAPNFASDLLTDSGANAHIFFGANPSTTTGGVTTLPASCGARTATGTWSNAAYPALAVN